MLHTAAQADIAAFGLIGVLFINIGKPRWAPVFGILGQPGWFHETLAAGQWGMFVMCFAYATMWLIGIRTWWWKPWLARRRAGRAATIGTGWSHPADIRPSVQAG